MSAARRRYLIGQCRALERALRERRTSRVRYIAARIGRAVAS